MDRQNISNGIVFLADSFADRRANFSREKKCWSDQVYQDE